MKTKKQNLFFILTVLLLCFYFFQTNQTPSGGYDLSSEAPATGDDSANKSESDTNALKVPDSVQKPYFVSGFLKENPNQKVYLQIENKIIKNVLTKKPKGIVYESNAWIAPAFIDMHNHLKYNILPLWSQAKGQFMNRYEWRDKFPTYKDAGSFNMRAVPLPSICTAVRYAELKALFGGASAVQGIGGDRDCALNFGVKNVEIPDEYKKNMRAMGLTDFILPEVMKPVHSLNPEMLKFNGDYDLALLSFMESNKILDWYDLFVNQNRTLKNALLLTVGNSFNLTDSQNSVEDLQVLKKEITDLMVNSLKVPAAKADVKFAELVTWIFGEQKDNKPGGYLASVKAEPAVTRENLVKNDNAYNYLKTTSVMIFAPPIKSYITDFEYYIRSRAMLYLANNQRMGIITHLSEGARLDPYNLLEYQYLKKYKLNKAGMVLIHAVGMTDDDIKDLGANGVSVVWSPFSNLLLYSETMDVQKMVENHVNIAMGPDWTITGSKHMLDEMKLASQYVKKFRIGNISDSMIFDFATLNAAKALNMDTVVGYIKSNYIADFNLFRKKSNDFATDVMSAQEKDILLTVVDGRPLAGQYDLMVKISKDFQDTQPPELIDRSAIAACGFKKGLRSFKTSKADLDYKKINPEGNIVTYAGIFTELDKMFTKYRATVTTTTPDDARKLLPIDPLFACEDEYYQSIYGNFISKTLDENIAKKESLRSSLKINSYNPLE